MKILILTTKEIGGVNLSNQRLAKSLREKGHMVKIVSRKEDLGKDSLMGSFFTIRNYVKSVEGNYDIIYTQDWSMAFPLIFPNRLFEEKHYCCFCGLQKGFRSLFQDVVGGMMGEKIVAVSDSVKERFPDAKMIYRGVDFNEFKDLGLERDSVGWVERIHEDFNEEDLDEIAELSNLKPMVIRNLPHTEMNGFYNKCKVFISLPKKRVGFNNVWAEAMASGVPIVIGNDHSVGKSWPIEKVYSEDKVKEIENIITNHKHLDYGKWLKEKDITWDSAADNLIKFIGKGK